MADISLQYRQCNPCSRFRAALVFVSVLIGSGCTSVAYYGQATIGHLGLLTARTPIDTLIADTRTSADLRQRLLTVSEILDYAHAQLGLPDNGSYRHYTDTGRDFVVWNVYAAPGYSLEPRRWCYPFAGCLSYRGYFSRERALRQAETLREHGFEVYTAGISAYSTLGWLPDPLLNTMFEGRADWELARLLFHELAHQWIHINGETEFNEAFAEAVARAGVERWLRETRPGELQTAMESLRLEDAFIAHLLELRARLALLYERPLDNEDLLADRKRRLLGEFDTTYPDWKRAIGSDDRYDHWPGKINNARLAVLSSYRTLVPDFLAIYEACQQDMPEFLGRIRQLAGYNGDRLYVELKTLSGPDVLCH